MLNPISILLDARRCVFDEKRDNWLTPFTVLTHAVARLTNPETYIETPSAAQPRP
jgi:hypothetical protein